MSFIKNFLYVSLFFLGGQSFTTSRSTLTEKEPDSMLARMFDQNQISPSDQDPFGAYLIDRSPKYFEPILNYLRSGKLIVEQNTNLEGVLEEAKFYGIEKLVQQLEGLIEAHTLSNNKSSIDVALTRIDVINAIINTSPDSELRFQGINLRNADLRKLDLRRINFKYACLAGKSCIDS